MAIVDGAKVGGIITYWSLADQSDHGELVRILTARNLERFAPEPVTGSAALRQAMQQVLGNSQMLIRQLQSRQGFTAVRESRGLNSNTYDTFGIAHLDEQGVVTCSPEGQWADRVREAYKVQLGLLPHATVSRCLVRIVSERLSAVTPRASGGFYWIPPYHMHEWDALADLLEGCGSNRSHAIFRIRHTMDVGAMRAVRDAIEREITATASRIKDEILNGELGNKAIETRVQEAQTLHEKIREYEAILGVGLTHLHNAADDATVAVGAGTMLT